MEIHFTPELETKLNELAELSGCSLDQLVEEAVGGYLYDLAGMRETLDRRYNEMKSGKVEGISGDEVFARLREKSESRRPKPE